MPNQITVEQNVNNLTTTNQTWNVTIVNPEEPNITVVQEVANIVTVATPGPQGAQGPTGPAGSVFDFYQIVSGSVSASVNIDPSSLFIIRSGSIPYLTISSSGDTTVYSDLFIIRNFTTKQPVLTVSQSIIQFNTHSIDPTGTTLAGSVYFTSASFFVGLE